MMHILKLRLSKKAHPQIRSLMKELHKSLKVDFPIIFLDKQDSLDITRDNYVLFRRKGS